MVRRITDGAVASIEAEIADLNGQGAALCSEIERLVSLQDEPDDADDAVRAIGATQAARNRLRKLDARIADARERLAAAKQDELARLRRDLLQRFAAVKPVFLAKARETQALLQELIAAREALQAAGLRSDYDSLPVPPSINGSALLAADLLLMFEESGSQGRRAIIAPPPARTTEAARIVKPQNRRVSLDDRQPPRAPLRLSAGEGERLFVLHAGRMDHPRHGPIQAGDVVGLTDDEAAPLIRSGKGDFITAEEIAAIDASAARPAPAQVRSDAALQADREHRKGGPGFVTLQPDEAARFLAGGPLPRDVPAPVALVTLSTRDPAAP